MRFNIPPTINPDSLEDSVILGNDCELIHTRQQVFEPGMVISSITAGGQSAFLYTTLNPVTRETSIFSTSSAQPIWDRGSQELKHQIADKVPISLELQNITPQLEKALKQHYFDRITAPGRFTSEAILMLLDEENLFDKNFTIKENLQRAIEHASIINIHRFLQNLIEIEARNSKILCISDPLTTRPTWRVLIRPLGLCIITQTSYLSSVEAAINLSSIEKEFYWATSDTRLLIQYLSLLKTAVGDSLHMLEQSIFEQPELLRKAAMVCLGNAKNQSVVLKLANMLSEASPDLQDQLNFFLEDILERLVLSHTNKGKQMIGQANVKMGEAPWMESLSKEGMKVLEQTIRHEVDALLLILIDVYLGQILLQNSTQILNEDKLARVEGWICQMAGLKQAFNSDYSSSSKTQKKPEGETVLEHLLLLNRENSDIKASFDIDQPTDASELLIKFIKVYTQVDNLMDLTPCQVPFLARQLIELKQYSIALDYLRMLRTESLGVMFAKVYVMSCMGDRLSDKGAFMTAVTDLINSTLLLSEKTQSRIDLRQTFLNTRKISTAKENLLTRIQNLATESRDARLHYLLLCASELTSSEVIEKGGTQAEHYASFFILRCLQMGSNSALPRTLATWAYKEQDYLLQCLFDGQKSVSTIDMLHYATTNLKDLKIRQTYLLKFFESVRGVYRASYIRSAILTDCFFSQSDLTLLIEALQEKITRLLGNKEPINEKWREDLSTTVQIYHDVAQAYHWQDQFVRFAWGSWESQIAFMLTSTSNATKKGALEQVLTFSAHLMTLAFTACQQCGEDFYFHSGQSVKNSLQSTGRKRSYHEAMNSGQMPVDQQSNSLRSSNASTASADSTSAFWRRVDHLRSQPVQFNNGKLERVDSQRLMGVLLMCRARLFCLKQQITSACYSEDPLYISKVLVELDQPDLAIELALANNVSPAFAIATQLDKIKNSDIRDGEDEEEDKMRQDKINDMVDRYLMRVKPQHLGELAQYLIALRITFSPSLKHRLIAQKQVSYVVGCYLSPEITDVVRAVDFLVNSEMNDKAISILIDSDLNQVVNLMKLTKTAQDLLAETQRGLSNEYDRMQKMIQDSHRGPNLRGLFRADSVNGVSGLAGIQAAIGRSDVISAILAEDPMSGFAKFDYSIEVMKNLKKCEENISTLKNGSEKIRASLKRVMNQN